MADRSLSADYLIMGAGATGMAFADTLLDHTDATMVLVDRRDRPGGHWVDAYPFVRLHQPASFYGLNSTPLGSGAIDASGLNAGFHTLASGPEVVSYYHLAMQERFLASGRVTYLPMHDLGDDRVATSLLSGARCAIEADRFVDATWSRMNIPATTPPAYDVAPGATCVPINDLPRMAPGFDEYVVVGAGKTGMDACIWLLEHGADPAQVRWVVPRDSWTLNRAHFQPGDDAFVQVCKGLGDQAEAAALADSVDDLFIRLESTGGLRRIDPDVWPGAYHCAILSDGELTQLRRIDGVIRMGRVQAIGTDEIRLDHGTVPTGPTTLHVDCSARGIPTLPSRPVFEGDRITLQWVRTCQPAFSAAMIGFVESAFDDDATKNRICGPIAPTTVPLDMLRMYRTELANRAAWQDYPELGEWLVGARLDPFSATAQARLGVDEEATAHAVRYAGYIDQARANLDRLLADHADELVE